MFAVGRNAQLNLSQGIGVWCADGTYRIVNELDFRELNCNVVLCFVLLLAILGLQYAIKANLGLLHFTGLFFANFVENLGPGFQDGFDFLGVLVIFFPAASRILVYASFHGTRTNHSNGQESDKSLWMEHIKSTLL